MRVKNSELVLDKTWVHAGYFATVYPESTSNKRKANFDIPIDIDFEVHKTAKSFTLTVEIKTTEEEEYDQEPGYRFSVYTEAIFKFSGRMNKMQKDYYIKYSALALAIAHIRGYLTNITSYGFYGQYTLPAIQLDDLVEQKAKKASPPEVKQ